MSFSSINFEYGAMIFEMYGAERTNPGTNLASVYAPNASLRTAAGGNAADAVASGSISVFKRLHSSTASSSTYSRKHSKN